MEGTEVIDRQKIIVNRHTGESVIDYYNPTVKAKKSNPVEEKLVAEDNGNFMDYLEWLGMLEGQNILVLPVRQHYFYDVEDFREIKAIINLKRLNLVRNLNLFLENIFKIMQPGTELIGCFYDQKATKGVSLSSRVYKKVINFLDSRFEIDLDKKNLQSTFQDNGFTVVDMTEINGLTYFRLRNRKKSFQVSS